MLDTLTLTTGGDNRTALITLLGQVVSGVVAVWAGCHGARALRTRVFSTQKP